MPFSASAADWYVDRYSPFTTDMIAGEECRYLRLSYADSASSYTPALNTTAITNARFVYDKLDGTGTGADITLKSCTDGVDTNSCTDMIADINSSGSPVVAALTADADFLATTTQFLRAQVNTAITGTGSSILEVCGSNQVGPIVEVDPFFKQMNSLAALESQIGSTIVTTEADPVFAEMDTLPELESQIGGVQLATIGDITGGYNIINMPQDHDGDGTSWYTCDCGGDSSTTSGYSYGWLCGTHATSETNITQFDWSVAGGGAGADSANNPEECSFHGQRIWDDIADDFNAIRNQYKEGTKVVFETGTYVLKGNGITSNNCWNSTSQDYTQTCAVNELGRALIGIEAIHSNMTLEGQGVDTDGFLDLKYDGTHFVHNKGLRNTWTAVRGGTTLINGDFKIGDPNATGAGSAIVRVGIRKGNCGDLTGDGVCDNTNLPASDAATGGNNRLSSDIDTGNTLCIENSGGYVTNNMTPGSLHTLTQTNMGGGISRTLIRVGSIGGACGSAVNGQTANSGLLVSLGPIPVLENINGAGNTRPTIPFEVMGSDSSSLIDRGSGNSRVATVGARIDESRMPQGITVTGFYITHNDYIGTGGCTDGTQAVCDNGSLITLSSGYNITLDNIGIINSNTAMGSGGAINTAPSLANAKVRNSIFRYNTGGGLVDISNYMQFTDNVVSDNTALNTINSAGNQSASVWLIRNQGFMYKITNNIFERNDVNILSTDGTGTNQVSSVVDMIGDYGTFSGNKCLQSSSTCLNIGRGVRYIDISENVFDVGSFTNITGNRSYGASIYIAGDNPSGNGVSGGHNEFIDIHHNDFLRSAKTTNINDAAPSYSAHILVKSSADIALGGIGPGGINVTDNSFQTANPDSAVFGIRGTDDPDNARIYFADNIVTQGKIAFGIYSPVAFGVLNMDAGFNGGVADDGIGLLSCGANRIGEEVQTTFAWDASRAWPTECIPKNVSEIDWNISLAAQSPDCSATGTLQGTVFTVIDDGPSAGACTDSNGDGRVDGGGSFKSTCVCGPGGAPIGLGTAGGSASLALNDLTDVSTAGVTTGQVIEYNGSSWEPATTGESTQPSPTSFQNENLINGNITDPATTQLGYGITYPNPNQFAAQPAPEANNLVGYFYNKTGVNSPGAYNQYEHAADASWEGSYRATATGDETWFELNYDLYPPINRATVTSPQAGFNPQPGEFVTFSAGTNARGYVRSYNTISTNLLEWIHDFGQLEGTTVTVTDASGDTATITVASVTSRNVEEGWRAHQFEWKTRQNNAFYNWRVQPRNPLFPLRIQTSDTTYDGLYQHSVAINYDGSILPTALTVGSHADNNPAVSAVSQTQNLVSNNPSYQSYIIDLRHDFRGTDNTYNGSAGIRMLQPFATGANSSNISGRRRAFYVYNQLGYGSAGSVFYADDQTCGTGATICASNPSFYGNITHAGGLWNNGHIALKGEHDDGNHIWVDDTTTSQPLRYSTAHAPDNATDGAQILTGKPVTTDPCANAPEAYVFYNDTDDQYCFCDGLGVGREFHNPNTACF